MTTSVTPEPLGHAVKLIAPSFIQAIGFNFFIRLIKTVLQRYHGNFFSLKKNYRELPFFLGLTWSPFLIEEWLICKGGLKFIY